MKKFVDSFTMSILGVDSVDHLRENEQMLVIIRL